MLNREWGLNDIFYNIADARFVVFGFLLKGGEGHGLQKGRKEKINFELSMNA